MSTVDPRDVLGVLPRNRLVQLGLRFELGMDARRRKEELIAMLVGSERISYAAILGELSRKELKAICRAHGMSDRGKAKAGIRRTRRARRGSATS